MRVTTEIFVAALNRRVFSRGGFAAIVRKGAAEAGAVFIVTGVGRLGERALYGPAPQTSYDESRPDDRQFLKIADGDDPDAIDKRLEREQRFDPDLWVIDLDLPGMEVGDFVTLTTP